MRITKIFFSVLFVAAFVLFIDSSAVAQDKMGDDKMKDDKTMGHKMKDDRPIVAVIYAEWCPYCKRVDPVVSELRKYYGEKMNFVVFDVSNEETTAEAKANAEKLGLSKFFADNKSKTSTVAVLKADKVYYKTSNNSKRDDYVKAFDGAIN
jgi:thiol-disulfide isomerase/thioredoxin